MSPYSESHHCIEKSHESHSTKRARPTVGLSEDVRDIGAPNQQVVSITEQTKNSPQGGGHIMNAGNLNYAEWNTGNVSAVAAVGSRVDDTGTALGTIQPVVPSSFSPANAIRHSPVEVTKTDTEQGAE